MWATVATIHLQANVLFSLFFFFFIIVYIIHPTASGLFIEESSPLILSPCFTPSPPAVHREREKYWEITARSWKTNSGEDGFPNCFYIHLQCIYMDIKFGYLPVAFQWSLKSVFIDQWLSQLSLFFSISGSSPFNIKPPSFYFLNFFFTLIES